MNQFSTEAQAREQWAAMQTMPQDLLEFAQETDRVYEDPDEHLASVFNVSTSRRPGWWTKDLLPAIKKSLDKIVANSVPKGAVEIAAPVAVAVAIAGEFNVTVVRNGSVVTAFVYPEQDKATAWATAMFKQYTGKDTKKFQDNQMPADSDWWSLTEKDDQLNVSVQLTKNVVPVKV